MLSLSTLFLGGCVILIVSILFCTTDAELTRNIMEHSVKDEL